MKYTNIKKLLIKFMGGGLINFPTRFLRWIKIDGDAEGDDGGDGGDDSGGGSTEVDYEAIYQFYKNKIVESLPQYFPEDDIENIIIPEHYTDIKYISGSSDEYRDKYGIWYMDYASYDVVNLFCEVTNLQTIKYICFGAYVHSGK